MKRLAAILLLASLSTACTLRQTGSRGPQIQRSADSAQHDDAAAERERALGQR